MFWLIILMVNGNLHDAGSVLSWLGVVFVSILVHEMGHALVMRAYGFRPWITLYALGGQASYDPRYVSDSKGSEPLGQVLICLAGPVAGFLLAGTLVLGLMAAGYGDHLFFISPWGLRPYVFELANQRLASILNGIFFVSVVWGMVNLLPIYPLDGGQVAREIFLKLSPREGIRASLSLSIVAAVAMAVIGFVTWHHDWFVVLFFGYLAYTSYATLQAYSGRNSR
jgi:membrane-associated protease RseP (regulator of RpoE activity)